MSADDVARYKRPPRKGQFQPGQTGNPRGRPKGSKNIRTYVHQLLGAKVPVIERGKTRNIPRAEAIAIQLVNLALKADPKGLAAVLSMTREFDEATGQARSNVLSRVADIEVMQDIIARIRAEQPLPSADGEPKPSADETGQGLESPDKSSEQEPE